MITRRNSMLFHSKNIIGIKNESGSTQGSSDIFESKDSTKGSSHIFELKDSTKVSESSISKSPKNSVSKVSSNKSKNVFCLVPETPDHVTYEIKSNVSSKPPMSVMETPDDYEFSGMNNHPEVVVHGASPNFDKSENPNRRKSCRVIKKPQSLCPYSSDEEISTAFSPENLATSMKNKEYFEDSDSDVEAGFAMFKTKSRNLESFLKKDEDGARFAQKLTPKKNKSRRISLAAVLTPVELVERKIGKHKRIHELVSPHKKYPAPSTSKSVLTSPLPNFNLPTPKSLSMTITRNETLVSDTKRSFISSSVNPLSFDFVPLPDNISRYNTTGDESPCKLETLGTPTKRLFQNDTLEELLEDTVLLESSSDFVQSIKNIMKSVVAFVDVRSSDGNNSSLVIQNRLKAAGATIVQKVCPTVTHCVFREGLKSNYTYCERRKIPMVNVSWVEACITSRMIMSVDKYPSTSIEKYADPLYRATLKKSKSMQPKDFSELEIEMEEKMKKRRKRVNSPANVTPSKNEAYDAVSRLLTPSRKSSDDEVFHSPLPLRKKDDAIIPTSLNREDDASIFSDEENINTPLAERMVKKLKKSPIKIPISKNDSAFQNTTTNSPSFVTGDTNVKSKNCELHLLKPGYSEYLENRSETSGSAKRLSVGSQIFNKKSNPLFQDKYIQLSRRSVTKQHNENHNNSSVEFADTAQTDSSNDVYNINRDELSEEINKCLENTTEKVTNFDNNSEKLKSKTQSNKCLLNMFGEKDRASGSCKASINQNISSCSSASSDLPFYTAQSQSSTNNIMRRKLMKPNLGLLEELDEELIIPSTPPIGTNILASENTQLYSQLLSQKLNECDNPLLNLPVKMKPKKFKQTSLSNSKNLKPIDEDQESSVGLSGMGYASSPEILPKSKRLSTKPLVDNSNPDSQSASENCSRRKSMRVSKTTSIYSAYKHNMKKPIKLDVVNDSICDDDFVNPPSTSKFHSGLKKNIESTTPQSKSLVKNRSVKSADNGKCVKSGKFIRKSSGAQSQCGNKGIGKSRRIKKSSSRSSVLVDESLPSLCVTSMHSK